MLRKRKPHSIPQEDENTVSEDSTAVKKPKNTPAKCNQACHLVDAETGEPTTLVGEPLLAAQNAKTVISKSAFTSREYKKRKTASIESTQPSTNDTMKSKTINAPSQGTLFDSQQPANEEDKQNTQTEKRQKSSSTNTSQISGNPNILFATPSLQRNNAISEDLALYRLTTREKRPRDNSQSESIRDMLTSFLNSKKSTLS